MTIPAGSRESVMPLSPRDGHPCHEPMATQGCGAVGCSGALGTCYCLFPIRMLPMKKPISEERASIVAFLRAKTHLDSIAQLLEDEADRYEPKVLERYCDVRGIRLSQKRKPNAI